MGMEPGRLTSLSLCAVAYSVAQFAAAVRRCLGVLRATAFWGTILLPFAVVGALLTDLATSDPFLFTVLLGANLLCIVLGQSYHPND
jgi:hypothetical protein